jgi:hypothetical protein
MKLFNLMSSMPPGEDRLVRSPVVDRLTPHLLNASLRPIAGRLPPVLPLSEADSSIWRDERLNVNVSLAITILDMKWSRATLCSTESQYVYRSTGKHNSLSKSMLLRTFGPVFF